MKIRVDYVVNVHKDVRRMVNHKMLCPEVSGLASLTDVAKFYEKHGTETMAYFLQDWIDKGRPE